MLMLIKAEQKYIRMSPLKLRYLVGELKKLNDPEKMIDYLSFVHKRASGPVAKVLKQAVANARNVKGATGALRVKEIQIGEGPRLKRWRAGPRGMAKPILKKTAHIRVILEVNEKQEEKKTIKEEKEVKE